VSRWSHPIPDRTQRPRFEPLPYDPEAYVITNVGRFANCRRDRFCRCRRCKPPLKETKQ